jgi:hypothetical protein
LRFADIGDEEWRVWGELHSDGEWQLVGGPS